MLLEKRLLIIQITFSCFSKWFVFPIAFTGESTDDHLHVAVSAWNVSDGQWKDLRIWSAYVASCSACSTFLLPLGYATDSDADVSLRRPLTLMKIDCVIDKEDTNHCDDSLRCSFVRLGISVFPVGLSELFYWPLPISTGWSCFSVRCLSEIITPQASNLFLPEAALIPLNQRLTKRLELRRRCKTSQEALAKISNLT